jgi:uncharacterized membrane protein YkvI
VSWFRSHFVNVRPDIASFSRVWVWNVLSCLCGAPSLTTGRVSESESLDSQYVLVSIPLCGRLTRYCSLFRVWVWNLLSCLCLCLSLTTGRVSESESLGSQYVLVSIPLCGRLTRYCFLFKSLSLEFVVLSLWGALFDERPGLSFVGFSKELIRSFMQEMLTNYPSS